MSEKTINAESAPRPESEPQIASPHGATVARLESGVTRSAPVEILVDGVLLTAYEGETVAAALLAANRRALRTTGRRGEPRGVFCGIGTCFDCVMTIAGQPSVRTCQTLVRDGMRVESQKGEGVWRISS